MWQIILLFGHKGAELKRYYKYYYYSTNCLKVHIPHIL